MDYKEEIVDHYKHPRNFGELADATVSVRENNSSCGDMIQVEVRLEKTKGESEKNKVIQGMAWRGVGCAISTAAASMLSEKVIGMSKTDLENFGEKGVVDLLGGEINAGRIKCATLAYRAILKTFES